MQDIEIMACCYSEKGDVSIDFGTSYSSEDGLLDHLDAEWIYTGMGESFWENIDEFKGGIEKAKQYIQDNPDLSFRQALYSIFGDFFISYEINGEEADIDLEVDVNQAIYDMLELG